MSSSKKKKIKAIKDFNLYNTEIEETNNQVNAVIIFKLTKYQYF